MTLRIGNLDIAGCVLLAPMAGITDAPFRELVSRYGAGTTTSEMIASQGLAQANKDALHRSQIGTAYGPKAIQIAGCDPEWMGKAAKIASDMGADTLDINMGCPAKKVTNGQQSGSALMKDPDHALGLIESVVKNSTVPVTLKMRLGWCENSLNAPEIAARAESAGIQMITIHGRTRMQFYKGEADWQAIAPVKNAVSIPVIANGDIIDLASARKALAQSNADGIMIGRGAQGKPWLPAQIEAGLRNETYSVPDLQERENLLIEHYQMMIDHYGLDTGLRIARKHVSWSLSDLLIKPGSRKNLMTISDPETVMSGIRQVFSEYQEAA